LKLVDEHLFRIYSLVTVMGIVQFIILTHVAAVIYPGGYDYFGYYFSDLGAVTARNGDPNTLSSNLFSVSLTLVALSLTPSGSIFEPCPEKRGSPKL